MEYNQYFTDLTLKLSEIWQVIIEKIQNHPEKLNEAQLKFFSNLQNLDTGINFFDKRFSHEDWQKNFMLDFIKRSYLLFSKESDEFIAAISANDPKTETKLKFYVKQFLDAYAPSNFANINPEVVSEALKTHGANFFSGFQNFLNDINFQKGSLDIKLCDNEFFQIGKNIAITPGRVIYQNEIMQLIEYYPATQSRYQIPILIIPPWINKYYILDLQPQNSLVKWLVEQGHHVFMISWVNADKTHAKKDLNHYLQEGPLAAIKTIQKHLPQPDINVVGYCVGGTLLACLLGFLKEKNKYIKSASFLTTLLDFSEPGDLGVFINENEIDHLESDMNDKGYMDGMIMARTFNALRAKDLIWGAFINNYLKGQKPKPLDLLYWNADSTHIPAKLHSYYLRNMYLENNLIQSNKIKLNKVCVDLKAINISCYFLAAKDDHIIPWTSSYQSHFHLKAPSKFVLTKSGHVAGVVNPPLQNKYGYWTNNKTPKDPEKFLATATFHEGSWWNDWLKWLSKHSGTKIKTEIYHQATLEPAPGSYVKKHIY